MSNHAMATGRMPGVMQGWLLVATTWLAVAAPAVIAPIAPRMAEYFVANPQAVALVQISIGLPALFVALLSGLFGALADRIGRRRLLLAALLVYACCGVLPIWLESLPQILIARAGVGIAEAAVLATGTALLAIYFQGRQRDKWFAVQGGTATLVAVLLLSLSGALSATGWRLSFAIYVGPVLLAALVARRIWEPADDATRREREAAPAARLWPGLLGVCAVTVFTAVAFYIVLVQLPFLLTERGFGGAAEIAFGTVAASITAPLGAAIFRLLAARPVTLRLSLSFACSATGLLVIAADADYAPMLVGAAINGIGSGIALPSLMAWAMAGRTQAVMGRVAGTWNSSYALGQFFSPPLFLGVAGLLGGAAPAMALCAAVLAVAAVAGLAMLARQSLLPAPATGARSQP